MPVQPRETLGDGDPNPQYNEVDTGLVSPISTGFVLDGGSEERLDRLGDGDGEQDVNSQPTTQSELGEVESDIETATHPASTVSAPENLSEGLQNLSENLRNVGPNWGDEATLLVVGLVVLWILSPYAELANSS